MLRVAKELFHARDIGIASSLFMPSEALWNKAASLMTTKLMNLMPVTPFTSATEPSTLMLIYSGVYLLAALAIAILMPSAAAAGEAPVTVAGKETGAGASAVQALVERGASPTFR